MCSELASYRVPHSLNHGDLHSGNITGETLLFFDWTDACIGHPFLDLSTVVADVEDGFPGGQARVLDTYFNLWTAYEPMDRLRMMWRLAEPLAALHQAVSYQHILAILEPTSKRELAMGVPRWLRRVMQSMAD
jgi:aminoglycoside phosphotransferase (APT) family kinase protein